MLAVVLLPAPYEDRPWGWTRNEISLIVIGLESRLIAPCVLTIRACYHTLLFTVLVNHDIQLGVSFDYVSELGTFSDVRGYTTMLVQLKVLYIQRDAQGLVLSGAAWVHLAASISKYQSLW